MAKRLVKKRYFKERIVSICAGISPMSSYESQCWSGVCYASNCYHSGTSC